MTTGTDPATASHAATYYVADKNRDYAQVLAEWQVSWTGSAPPVPSGDALAVTYCHGHDLIQQTRDPDGPSPSTHYFHYDGQLSTRHLTGSDGTPTDSYTYGAYGDLLASTGSTTNSYRYTGEQLDPDLGAANTPGTNNSAGLYYLRARYYSPGQGRFTGRDAFEGVQHDPMSLHKYLYAEANPVNNADPSGLLAGSFVVATQIGILARVAAHACMLAILAPILLTTMMVVRNWSAQLPYVNTAQALNVPTGTESDLRRSPKDGLYFLHATSTGAWGLSTEIDLSKGREELDFGQGFYTYSALDPRAYADAVVWARRQARRSGGLPMIIVWRTTQGHVNSLTRASFVSDPTWRSRYSDIVNRSRLGDDVLASEGIDLAIGPIAKQAGPNLWVPDMAKASQYVFKTGRAISGLRQYMVIPVAVTD